MSDDKIIRGDGNVSMEGSINAEQYDALADDYDKVLEGWGYEAPAQSAKMLSDNLQHFAAAHILDCGCGTGLTGQALRSEGARGAIVGADISKHSLELAAAKNVYDETVATDLNSTLPFAADSFDGVLCAGVLSYVEAKPLFREWQRVVRSGGVIVFTSREDLFVARGYAKVLQDLEAHGGWKRLELTEAMPYLPGHAEFAKVVGVVYGVYQV